MHEAVDFAVAAEVEFVVVVVAVEPVAKASVEFALW